jgi:hypothetical protein
VIKQQAQVDVEDVGALISSENIEKQVQVGLDVGETFTKLRLSCKKLLT